jgi:hypothetical protein
MVWPNYKSLSIYNAQAVPRKVNHKAMFVNPKSGNIGGARVAGWIQ